MLGLAVRVAVDDRHGGIQDGLGGAVVLLQQDHLGIGVIFLEAQQVAVIGAAPGVDGLVGVADHEDVAVEGGHMLEQLVLRQVGILELIHQHVLEAPGVPFTHGLVRLEEHGDPEEQVVEIHAVVGQQQLLVAAVDTLDHLVAVGLDGVIVRLDQLVLGVRDGSEHPLRLVALLIHVQVLQGTLDQADLVIIVEDDKVGIEGQVLSFAAQDAGAGGVEGAQGETLSRACPSRPSTRCSISRAALLVKVTARMW